jgi:glycosyltransferase involved in cell wall biosynthesis
MRICNIWDAEYPWDVRVEKITRELTAAGHEVHLVARNRDNRPAEEQLTDCRVHRLVPLPWLGQRLNAASMFPAFFNPRWLRGIIRVARDTRADVLMVRDLPLAPTAIWAGRHLGLPVVFDMAENYPAMIRSMWETGCYSLTDRFVRNPTIVAQVERWCLSRVDHILVVVEESRDRLLQMGVAPDKVTIVSNTPPVSRLDSIAPAGADDVTTGSASLDVAYLGLLEEPRGVATLIRAVALAREARVPVRLSLLGDGRERQRFEGLAEALGLGHDVVRFHGFVPYAQAVRRLEMAHVGAIPHRADESWNTTIPNKLFDYMAAGVSVLASDSPPVARVVRETGCGEIFRSGDPEDAARAISRLADAERRRCFAAAGRAAIRERYHWGHDAARLRHVFGEMEHRRVSCA